MPPNACRVELSFFERLYELKLNDMKLDESDLPISAFLRGSQMALTSHSLQSVSAAAKKRTGDGDDSSSSSTTRGHADEDEEEDAG